MLDQNARLCEAIYFMRLDRDTERPLLLDGAIGTELIARGLRVRAESPEAWNLERPDDVRAIHAAYVEAGAAILQTNTFGVTRPRLARFNLQSRQREIVQRAVDLAKDLSEVAGRVSGCQAGECLRTIRYGPDLRRGRECVRSRQQRF